MPDRKTLTPADIGTVYAEFQAPVTAFDCGAKCAPYNQLGVPFCCDKHHAVPTAYQPEWSYLQANTDLWQLWQAEDPTETARLQAQTPDGQVVIACHGHTRCQRSYRSITCRAFPFFPYMTRQGDFLGLTYYWDYEDRCWVVSHLSAVTPAYREQFVAVYERLFDQMPEERENFRRHSAIMRQIFGRRKRAIPLLHRNGLAYKIAPRNGRMRRVPVEKLPKHGPYKLAAGLPFPGESENE